MADTFSKQQRSRIMAAVRSTNNKLTERKLVGIFRAHGIKGWRRQLPLAGKPDFTFGRERVVVFVDGCFWHGCKKHLRLPSDNREYWVKKISTNMNRDRITVRTLKKAGWTVLRIWEHELKSEPLTARRVIKALNKGDSLKNGKAA